MSKLEKLKGGLSLKYNPTLVTKLSDFCYETENINQMRNLIKGVNLSFTSLNTCYLMSIHPLRKNWHLKGTGSGGKRRKGGRRE